MNKPVKILVTGDTHLGGGRVKSLALKQDERELFGSFLDKIQEADISVTNLESPLIEKGKEIKKTGPNLKSSPRTLSVLQVAGFDLLTLANNHIMDYGPKGLKSTLDASLKEGMATVGAGETLNEAVKAYTVKKNDMLISFINIAENEFSTAQDDSPGAHPLDPIQNYYTIQKAKEKSDRVVVIIHGGHEHYRYPSPRMVKTYRFFVDAGADAVLGHHTHCVSGYEVYKGAPIFYSLGNFLFDKSFTDSPGKWHKGMMVELITSTTGFDFEFYPFIQNAEEGGLRSLNQKEEKEFQTELKEINSIIQDSEKLTQEFESFCHRSQNQYKSYIEPHSVRLLHALQNRNLFPSFLSDRKKRLFLNLIRCEAHRDALIKILNQ